MPVDCESEVQTVQPTTGSTSAPIDATPELLHASGDVDSFAGALDHPGSIVVDGTVRSGVRIRAGKDITVRGAVESAHLEAGDTITIRGGVAAESAGEIVANGRIIVKFSEAASLRACGDIIVLRDVVNSAIRTSAWLDVSSGVLLGGYTYARDGAEIRELGNDAGIATRVTLGRDMAAIAHAAERDKVIKAKQDAVAQIRERVQPLLAMQKRLAPQQREQATELLCRADEIEEEVHGLERERDTDFAARLPVTPPVLHIGEVIFAGVTVIFGDRMVVFNEARKGPLRIEERRSNSGQTAIVLQLAAGQPEVLPSCAFTLPGAATAKA